MNGLLQGNKISPMINTSNEERKENDNFKNNAEESVGMVNEVTSQKLQRVSPVKVISDAKISASRWLANTDRFVVRRGTSQYGNKEYERELSGGFEKGKFNHFLAILSDVEQDDGDEQVRKHKKKRQALDPHSKALIHYFARLAASVDDAEIIDLDFVETLINNGGKISVTDRHGQTLLHEVARQWHVEAAKFLVQKGCDVNQADRSGRSPLHVAAAVDYPEMVEYLIEQGADIHARTIGEMQTPIHFAARNDAVKSLQILLRHGANINDRDYKRRTPLQIAAELDRSDTARALLDVGAPAGVKDDSGLSALVLMIAKMPGVAKIAMNQFYSADRANRKQYYYLNYLEPIVPSCLSEGWAQTPMEVVVQHKQFDIIMHPVFQRLLKVKWKGFAMKRVWGQVAFHLLFVLVWTALSVLYPGQGVHPYVPLTNKWWRIVLEILGVLMTLRQIQLELREIHNSKKEHHRWVEWREKELMKDLEFCHPRWPEEQNYIQQEIEALHDQAPAYFSEKWNFIDWIIYLILLLTIVTHVFNVLYLENKAIFWAHARIMSAMLICIWMRLMKIARAFMSLGPFVVMITHLFFDTLKFFFIFIIVYIPFSAAFWIIFGGNQEKAVEGFSSVPDLLFSMFRMTVVDEYNFEGLQSVDPYMAKILCGIYISISAIILLNLFIALMSDTFQRVYDNAKANAMMQQASTILNIEASMGVKNRQRFASYIHNQCAPEELYFDDDIVDESENDLQKMTHQIKSDVVNIRELLDEEKETAKRNGLVEVRQKIQSIEEKQDLFIMELREMREVLQDIVQNMKRKKKTRIELRE